MQKSYIKIAAFAALLYALECAAPPAAALAFDTQPGQFAPAGGLTSQPVGFQLFCRAQPGECRATSDRVPLVKIDDNAWNQLQAINLLVNTNIEGIGDDAHYGIFKRGIANWWTYPDDGKGNCNDYVLLKRKLLIEAGWPEASLLLTVVLDHENKGHLVLTVATDLGDLILDNMVDQVVRWDQTGYKFIKRQSPLNAGQWLAIQPLYAATASSSVQLRQ